MNTSPSRNSKRNPKRSSRKSKPRTTPKHQPAFSPQLLSPTSAQPYAGGAWLNSPPPSALPMPSFLRNLDVQRKLVFAEAG